VHTQALVSLYADELLLMSFFECVSLHVDETMNLIGDFFYMEKKCSQIFFNVIHYLFICVRVCVCVRARTRVCERERFGYYIIK